MTDEQRLLHNLETGIGILVTLDGMINKIPTGSGSIIETDLAMRSKSRIIIIIDALVSGYGNGLNWHQLDERYHLFERLLSEHND